MGPNISKTIDLIKKSYDQPILFHLLHSHLSHLLLKTTPVYEMSDDWSKILIFSCHPNKSPNQGLEIKLQQNLKRFRPQFDNEKKLKAMIVCYYLLNRPSNLINHILVFELVSEFLGFSDYFDGLILRIFSNMLISKIYSLEDNKKLKEDTITRMQEIIKSKNLSDMNKVRSLVCFISGDIEPFRLDFITILPTFQSFKVLEIICLYAKYTKNTSFIHDVLPSDEFFIQGLEQFMKFEFTFDGFDFISADRCCIANQEIYERIKQEFDRSSNKEKFISELIDFVSTLK